MGLMSRSARGAVRHSPRAAETRKNSPANTRNRKKTHRGTRFSVSLKRLGKFLSWVGTLGLCLAVMGFLTTGLLYGYRYLTISPYFAVKQLEITGNVRLSSREVLEIAELHDGMNSLLVSIDDVERRLAANPWVAAVSVRRSLPDRFTIRLREKEPRFWVRQGGTLYYADARGALIVPVSAGSFASFPTLEVEAGAEDLTELLPELLTSLAASRIAMDVAALSEIRLSPGRGMEVFWENDRLTLSIGQEEWTQNLGRLAATLADVTRRGELRDVREVRVHGAKVWVIKKEPVV